MKYAVTANICVRVVIDAISEEEARLKVGYVDTFHMLEQGFQRLEVLDVSPLPRVAAALEEFDNIWSRAK